MTKKIVLFGFIITLLNSCNSFDKKDKKSIELQPTIQVVGAMQNVMRKGELAGTINLDTVKHKNGLYGLGPVEYLAGELLVIDGKSYVARVKPDSTLIVQENYQVKAPFFVYTNQVEWTIEDLPSSIKTIKKLEQYLNEKALYIKQPFVFKLKGVVDSAKIHVQNLPKGIKVNSPKEAHQGQVNYWIKNREVEIVGFFSTKHKGIFTHHDSNVHMHLITTDRMKMGHLDELFFRKGSAKLYLPKNSSHQLLY